MSVRATSGAGRERPTLLLGVGAIMAILLVGRGLPAWREALASRRDGAAQLHAQLAGAERALAGHAAVRDTLAARNLRLQAVSATLVPGGADDGAAGRALAAMVSGAAVGAEVRLTSTSVVEDRPRGTGRAAMGEASGDRRRAARPATLLRTVAVRIAGTGDVRGIATLLQALERGPARLRVRSMAISQPDVGAGDDRVETLQLEMVVEGLAVARRDSASRAMATSGRGTR